VKQPKWNAKAKSIMEYLPEGDEYVPIAEWGQDHWSVFAYLETAVVDHRGVINNVKMRCNARLHRIFANLGFGGQVRNGAAYPTLLKGGVLLERHDDWSCLEDMIAAGLMQSWFYDTGAKMLGSGVARVEFTDLGWTLAGQVRAHRGKGGNYANFVPVLPDAGLLQVPAPKIAIG
jgi:hypothetical protein